MHQHRVICLMSQLVTQSMRSSFSITESHYSRDSSNYAVAIRTIRDAPEHKIRTQQAPVEVPKLSPIERIQKVGLRQPLWQVLRHLFGKPYLNLLAEDMSRHSPDCWSFGGFSVPLRCAARKFNRWLAVPAAKSLGLPPQRAGAHRAAFIRAHLQGHKRD